MSINRREFVKQTAAVALTIGGAAYVGRPGRTDTAGESAPLRPPGALSEDQFIATCIRCMRCVDTCPNQALVSLPQGSPGGSGGTPTLHMRRAACMLCMSDPGEYLRCTEVCPSGALQLVRKEQNEVLQGVHIGIAEIDLELCYSYNNWSCGACYRACPFPGQAMTIGNWERPVVHPDACVGCGLCERVCIRYPHAIRVKGKEAQA